MSVNVTHATQFFARHAAWYHWVFQLLILLALTATVHSLEVMFYRRARPKLVRSKYIWDFTLLEAFHKPVGILIWLLSFSYGIDIIRYSTSADFALLAAIDPIRSIAVTAVIVWALLRFSRRTEHTLLNKAPNRKELDKTTVHAIGQLIRAAVLIIGILLTIQALGIPLSGVLAFGGFGGLAVGFAAKDTIGNFISGLMIYIDKPFKVGDWVRSPDKEVEGTVEQIGWRTTTVRTLDQRPLYVPNGTLVTISLENATRMKNRRINSMVGIRYEDADKVPVITANITRMLKLHPDIDHQETIFASLVNFSPSSLDIQVYAFTLSTDLIKFRAIMQDVLLKVMMIIEDAGAACAFPTTSLTLPEGIHLVQEKNREFATPH